MKRMVFAATLSLALLSFAVSVSANHLSCGVNGDSLTTTYDGNNSANNPNLTANTDSARGEGGNDTLNGEGSKDYLCGNLDNDTIHGDGGGDRINGGENIDEVHGDDGNDWIRAGDEADTARGEADADAIIAGDRGRDSLYGGGANDDLYPGLPGTDGGRDFVSGDGGASDDVFICQGTTVNLDPSTENPNLIIPGSALDAEYC